MFGKKLLFTASAVIIIARSHALFAQTPAHQTPSQTTTMSSVPEGGQPSYIKPETPEQRRMRLGMAEDPGTNPDPNKHYWRFGRSWHIEKFDRRWEDFEGADPGWVRPFGFVNLSREIYQRNERSNWVWMPDTMAEEAARETAQPETRYNQEQIQ